MVITKEEIRKRVEALFLRGMKGLTTGLKREIAEALRSGTVSKKELAAIRDEAEKNTRVDKSELIQGLPALMRLADAGKLDAERTKELERTIQNLLYEGILTDKELSEIGKKVRFEHEQQDAKKEVEKILTTYFSGKLGKTQRKEAMGKILDYSIKKLITFKDFKEAQEKLKSEKRRYERRIRIATAKFLEKHPRVRKR